MKNTTSRRDFLTTASAALLATQLPTFASTPAPPATAPKKIPLGLELYSVRTELARDLPKTLTAVAKQGYEIVEFFSPTYDWKFPYIKDVRSLMDDLGIRCFSTHNPVAAFAPGDGLAKAIEINQILGSKIIVLASNNANGLDAWKRSAANLTAAVETLKPHGLTAGFHNHQTEWVKIDGDKRIMDVLAENTPKEFVLQLDVGTCMEAGQDPVAWINQHPGRIRVIHLKEWAPGTRQQEKGYRTLFAEGVSPWKDIFAAAESVGGVEYYLMEQEGSRFPEIETTQRCLEAYKTYRAKT